jgi:methionine-rich copper-binding protein CopC
VLVLALLAQALVLGTLLPATAGPAAAHDVSTGTRPTKGAVLDSPPKQVELTFAKQLSRMGSRVQVTGPGGVLVSTGDPRVDGTVLTQALSEAMPAGTYTVVWHTASVDGHPVSGQYTFRLSGSSPTGATTGSPAGGVTALGVAGALGVAALVTATGVALYRRHRGPG